MTGNPAGPRRPQGLRSLASVTPALTDPLFRKRGFVEARIPRDWPDIVGATLAAACIPEALDFPRGRRDGATLRLRAVPGRALEIQHLAPQIVERVNGHFGWAAVERLTIRQGPLPPPRPSTRPRLRDLADGERAAIHNRVAGIADPDLRSKLAALGERLAARQPGKAEK